ncbi:MAG: hypothetical protein Q9202_006304 [Teloschistes flavicans]
MVSTVSAYYILFLHFFSPLVVAGPLPSIPSAVLALSQNSNATSPRPSPHLTLNALPQKDYHIDGTSPDLPLPYRITFFSYGPPLASLPNAQQCLARAASVMYSLPEHNFMGTKPRRYTDRGVIIEIEPGPRLMWGYWGTAIRAIDRFWGEWDAVEMEFAILVETEGVVGKGFVKDVKTLEKRS